MFKYLVFSELNYESQLSIVVYISIGIASLVRQRRLNLLNTVNGLPYMVVSLDFRCIEQHTTKRLSQQIKAIMMIHKLFQRILHCMGVHPLQQTPIRLPLSCFDAHKQNAMKLPIQSRNPSQSKTTAKIISLLQ